VLSVNQEVPSYEMRCPILLTIIHIVGKYFIVILFHASNFVLQSKYENVIHTHNKNDETTVPLSSHSVLLVGVPHFEEKVGL
jgi:hypothetical protein